MNATAASSPDAPPPVHLLDLPTELLQRVLSRLDGPHDIVRVAAVSLLFRDSLAEHGVRLWARERGFELPALPDGESCAVRRLCFAALLLKSNPPARAAAGVHHSLFIDGEGGILSCGKEEEEDWCAPGLLGHGHSMTRLHTPTRLTSTLTERAVSVAAGAEHSLAVDADGAVWSWGDGDFGRLGHGDNCPQRRTKRIEALPGQRVVAVSAGRRHSFALAADGCVWSWGCGRYGRLGHGDQQSQWQPKLVEALAGLRVVAVSAGAFHSLALTADGSVWSWGGGAYGQLGHGDGQDQMLPKKVEAFADLRVVTVSAGGYHSLALTADGEPLAVEAAAAPVLVARGNLSAHSSGAESEGAYSPGAEDEEEEADEALAAAAVPEVHGVATVGCVWSWGGGSHGKLGHGDEQDQPQPKKVEAFAGRRVAAVSAGGFHSLALTTDGSVWSWGDGDDGKLGHGDEQTQLLPKKIEALAGQRAIAVSAGGRHSLALTDDDGAVFTWGQGRCGCLGHGEYLTNQRLPKKIEAWAPAQ